MSLPTVVKIALALICFIAPAARSEPLKEPIKPIPTSLNISPEKANIGRQLFQDVRLSANGRVSCASCHDLARGGVDRLDHSVGFTGKITGVNAPTVLNAALNFKQFWNGRANTLEDQIDGVVINPVEMGSNWNSVVEWISKDEKYQGAFKKAYPEGVTKTNVINAIASYERTLITPNSRFDKYLQGNGSALTDIEKSGYQKFKQYGCVSCHQGVNVGGNMFQTFGVMGDYFKNRGNESEADLGRFNVTKKESDKHVFKVPSLRNIALTAPYFHDGSAKTLEQAVEVMFQFQLGRAAPKEDKEQIISFLKSLTGELDGKPL